MVFSPQQWAWLRQILPLLFEWLVPGWAFWRLAWRLAWLLT
jgi:hypothetical protein